MNDEDITVEIALVRYWHGDTVVATAHADRAVDGKSVWTLNIDHPNLAIGPIPLDGENPNAEAVTFIREFMTLAEAEVEAKGKLKAWHENLKWRFDPERGRVE